MVFFPRNLPSSLLARLNVMDAGGKESHLSSIICALHFTKTFKSHQRFNHINLRTILTYNFTHFHILDHGRCRYVCTHLASYQLIVFDIYSHSVIIGGRGNKSLSLACIPHKFLFCSQHDLVMSKDSPSRRSVTTLASRVQVAVQVELRSDISTRVSSPILQRDVTESPPVRAELCG